MQDVAVILVSKDKNNKVTMQIVGDELLYGKNYVVEPKTEAAASTQNLGYTGSQPANTSTSTTTVVVVESAPIVQYVYSPVYIPYYPPYYYGYYPPPIMFLIQWSQFTFTIIITTITTLPIMEGKIIRL